MPTSSIVRLRGSALRVERSLPPRHLSQSHGILDPAGFMASSANKWGTVEKDCTKNV